MCLLHPLRAMFVIVCCTFAWLGPWLPRLAANGSRVHLAIRIRVIVTDSKIDPSSHHLWPVDLDRCLVPGTTALCVAGLLRWVITCFLPERGKPTASTPEGRRDAQDEATR